MRVKTFREKDMKAALARVKAEMGPEAVILGNQTVCENGERLCEVMAALDGAPPGAAANGQGVNETTAGDGVPEAWTPPSEEWRREWREIKDHLLAFLKPRMEMGSLTPRQRLALEYLDREGVQDVTLLTLYRSIRERGEATVLPALGRLVGTRPLTAANWPQRVHVLAGPHGSGKTSALLRLALARKREQPGAQVLVVNADPGQGKGRMVLRHYADLSGLVYRELDSAEDFESLLSGLGPEDRAFVEAPGLKGDRTLSDWLRDMGMDGRTDLAAHLVLSPVYAPAQIRAFVAKYRADATGSIVWTKLDEACSFGSLINTAHFSGLPASALAYGPELKNSMAQASADALWRLIFKRELPGARRKRPDGERGTGVRPQEYRRNERDGQ